MNKVWLVLSCLILAFLEGNAQGITENKSSVAAFTRTLERQANHFMDRYDVPGVAIALIDGGEIAWSGAYGYADIENQRPMTVDAICRAESISKSVTAWGVMKLVERGLLTLDAPVRQYLGDWQLPASEFPPEEVTIRRLLSNSAGLQMGSLGKEYPPENDSPPLREYLSGEVRITYKPGSQFQYSNAGFNLLDLVVEEVTGRKFADYMLDEVLTPLGMRRSSYRWNEQWSAEMPMGYDLHGRPVPPYVYPASGSGGLFASIEDIARFVIAGMASVRSPASPVLSQKSIEMMQSPQVGTTGMFGFVADAYGFGHFIETLPDDRRAVWHGGQGHGWMTHFHAVPETGDGIVIFTNSQRSWPLMAQVLEDWASWNEIGPVKFSRITTVVYVLWMITAFLFLLVLWWAGRLIYEIHTEKRIASYTIKESSGRRLLEFLLFVIIMTLLTWAVNQDYLFLSSIFPLGTTWLGWGLAVLAATLLLSVLYPVLLQKTVRQS